jgi:hypothetical protein
MDVSTALAAGTETCGSGTARAGTRSKHLPARVSADTTRCATTASGPRGAEGRQRIDEGASDRSVGVARLVLASGRYRWPRPGGGYRMACDSDRGVTVLFGGDTCLWDDSRWRRAETPQATAPRSVHAFACDPVRKRVVLFGGTVDDRTSERPVNWMAPGEPRCAAFPDGRGHAISQGRVLSTIGAPCSSRSCTSRRSSCRSQPSHRSRAV